MSETRRSGVESRQGQPGKDSRRSGVTIVERVIALAVGMFAQGSLTITHAKQTHLHEEHRPALHGARAHLEVLKNHDFATVFAAFDELTFNDPPIAHGPTLCRWCEDCRARSRRGGNVPDDPFQKSRAV